MVLLSPGNPLSAHPLFLQVVSHLLMLTFRQLLITILVIFSEYGLNFCISMAFPESIERVEVNYSVHGSARTSKHQTAGGREIDSMLQKDTCFPK